MLCVAALHTGALYACSQSNMSIDGGGDAGQPDVAQQDGSPGDTSVDDGPPLQDNGIQPGAVCNFQGAPFAGAPTAIDVGQGMSAFVAWSNGSAVPYVWGPQGGTMITPTLRLPAGFAPTGEATPCIRVELVNNGTFAPVYRTLQLAFEAYRQDGYLWISPIFDQLGTSDFANGTPLNLGVRVWSTTARAEMTLMLTLVQEPYPAPAGQDCSAFAIESGPCAYRIFEGDAVLDMIADSPTNEFRCQNDPVRVTYRFVPDEHGGMPDSRCFLFPNMGMTSRFTTTSYANPPRACIRTADFQGRLFRVRRKELVRGTCAPVQVEPMVTGSLQTVQQDCTAMCQ